MKLSGKIIVRRVSGSSMAPALPHGQIIVALRKRQYGLGDIVVFEHEGLDKVKRLAALRPAGSPDVAVQMFVRGDNPEASTDSRMYGWITLKSVKGRVIWPRHSNRKPTCPPVGDSSLPCGRK